MTDEGGRSARGSNTDDLLRAILTVLIDEREQRGAERPGQRRTELILADAGLPPATIAQLLGKNSDAVRMAIARARKSASSPTASRNRSPTPTENGGGNAGA